MSAHASTRLLPGFFGHVLSRLLRAHQSRHGGCWYRWHDVPRRCGRGGGALAGSGGTLATGGVTGTGGSTAASDGSATTDLDSCSSDADCLSSCIWVTAPIDSSQCTAFYCCGMTWLSKKRCEANQAAWAFHCPNQSPQLMVCPCVELCLGDVFSCVAGQCTDWCPPRVDAGTR